MSIRQRAYPEPGDQLSALWAHCLHARAVYNLGLEHRQLRYSGRKASTSYVTQAAELTEARKEFAWLRAGSTVVQQGALRDLDRAYRNFFAGRSRFPQFRSAKDPRQGFVLRDVKVERLSKRWARVLVPKAGWLQFRITAALAELRTATSARVTCERDQWHVAFTTPPREKRNGNAAVGSHIGIDRGVANTLATSDGEFFQAPGLTEEEQRCFLALERRLARQPKCKGSAKPSARRQVTLDKLTVLRLRLVNRRRDWVEQVTTELALRHEAVAIEKLVIGNMVRAPKPKPDPEKPGAFLRNGRSAKAKLNAAIHASVWGRFAQRLEDKTDVVKVDPRFTSQQCHACGHTDARNRENQATFRCVKCGNTGHADTHAGMNIDRRGFPGDPPSRGTHGVRAPRELPELRFHPWSNANHQQVVAAWLESAA